MQSAGWKIACTLWLRVVAAHGAAARAHALIAAASSVPYTYGAAVQVAARFADRVMLVALFTEMIVPANGLVATVALPVPWLTMMYLPTSPAGAVALTKLAPASVRTACPDAPVPPVPIFPSPSAPYADTGNSHGRYCSPARSPAVTTCTTVNPDACATGMLPSAPRIKIGRASCRERV